jgi:hypothetical protein
MRDRKALKAIRSTQGGLCRYEAGRYGCVRSGMAAMLADDKVA